MRVKFDKRIYFCTVATHPQESKLLIFTTPNGIYTVDMVTSQQAEITHNNLLVNGYCDVSEFEYSN